MPFGDWDFVSESMFGDPCHHIVLENFNHMKAFKLSRLLFRKRKVNHSPGILDKKGCVDCKK